MKGSRFICAFLIVSALVLVAMLVTAGSAVAQSVTVMHWGQSEINEDGNLRFRVTASASGISWTDVSDAAYLQLWAHIVGPKTNPIINDTFVLIKSKTAYNRYDQAATAISGTSPRFKLPRGTYDYYLYVMLTQADGTELVISDEYFAGTVTLP